MYEATAVSHTDGPHEVPAGHTYCRFVVGMDSITQFDQHLSKIGAVNIVRPDKDIAEYQEGWDNEPDLCVTYWAAVPDAHMDEMQNTADRFTDRR